jgi:hypothetical protein
MGTLLVKKKGESVSNVNNKSISNFRETVPLIFSTVLLCITAGKTAKRSGKVSSVQYHRDK